MTSSRRDDLISLAQLLAEFFSGNVSWVDQVNLDGDHFIEIAKIKKKMTPYLMCTGQASLLLPFVEQVFSCGFDEEPHYGKL